VRGGHGCPHLNEPPGTIHQLDPGRAKSSCRGVGPPARTKSVYCGPVRLVPATYAHRGPQWTSVGRDVSLGVSGVTHVGCRPQRARADDPLGVGPRLAKRFVCGNVDAAILGDVDWKRLFAAGGGHSMEGSGASPRLW